MHDYVCRLTCTCVLAGGSGGGSMKTRAYALQLGGQVPHAGVCLA